MLKGLTLASLGETRMGELFKDAIDEVKFSLEKDNDVMLARSITIKLSLTPDDRGFVTADMGVVTKTPSRTVKSLASFEKGELKIDTISNDAKQPFLDGVGTNEKVAGKTIGED